MFNSPDYQLKEDVLPAESLLAYLPLPACAREIKTWFLLLFLYSQKCIYSLIIIVNKNFKDLGLFFFFKLY